MKLNAITILFLLGTIAFSTWLMFHTFSYDRGTQSIEIASKLWSDFGSHIPLIRSFSMAGNFERVIHLRMPEYPIYPDAPMRYHFLFYMLVGLLEKAGLRIDWALNIPSIIGFSSLLILIFYLATTLFRSNSAMQQWNNGTIGILSVLFFLFNGSLSFVRFFDRHPLSNATLLDIAKTTQFPSFGPWDGGLVSAFWNLNIYTNQRHLAAAFALGLLYIGFLVWIEKKPQKVQMRYILPTVLFLSVIPFFHQPMLVVMAIFSFWYFIVFPRLRIFLLLTFLGSLLVVFPQVVAIASTGVSSFSWYPGYLIHESTTLPNAFTYWFYNLGLHMFLMPLGFLFCPGRVKKIIFPLFLLFVVANLFKFSVEIAANHKFFNFMMIFGNMLTAYTVIQIMNGILFKKIYSLFHCFAPRLPLGAHCSIVKNSKSNNSNNETMQQLKSHTIALPGLILGCACIVILTLSGIIDFFVVKNDYRLKLPDIGKNEIAGWIAKNTPKDAIFLNSSYLYHPASIAGRSIFLGWPYFPWSAGYPENRMPIMKEMYESNNKTIICTIFDKYHISYVTVEDVSDNPDLPTINLQQYLLRFTPVFLNASKTYAIFSTSTLCTNTH